MSPRPEIPKKIFRHALKGVSYFSNNIKRGKSLFYCLPILEIYCLTFAETATLNGITAYVYLKNNRSLSTATTSQLTKAALDQLCSDGLIQNMRTTYRLNVLLTAKTKRKRNTQRQVAPRAQPELDDEVPGPSTLSRQRRTSISRQLPRDKGLKRIVPMHCNLQWGWIDGFCSSTDQNWKSQRSGCSRRWTQFTWLVIFIWDVPCSEYNRLIETSRVRLLFGNRAN